MWHWLQTWETRFRRSGEHCASRRWFGGCSQTSFRPCKFFMRFLIIFTPVLPLLPFTTTTTIWIYCHLLNLIPCLPRPILRVQLMMKRRIFNQFFNRRIVNPPAVFFDPSSELNKAKQLGQQSSIWFKSVERKIPPSRSGVPLKKKKSLQIGKERRRRRRRRRIKIGKKIDSLSQTLVIVLGILPSPLVDYSKSFWIFPSDYSATCQMNYEIFTFIHSFERNAVILLVNARKGSTDYELANV